MVIEDDKNFIVYATQSQYNASSSSIQAQLEVTNVELSTQSTTQNSY